MLSKEMILKSFLINSIEEITTFYQDIFGM